MKIAIKFVLIMFFSIIIIPSLDTDAKTIKGGVSYELNDIQKLAFKNEKPCISTKKITKYLKDDNEKSNLVYLKTNTRPLNRTLTGFYDNTDTLVAYSICYNDVPEKIFYYLLKDHKLVSFDVRKNIHRTKTYPYKYVRYTPDGKLTGISLVISFDETYMFNAKRQLTAHWKNSVCYDEKGEKVLKSRLLFD